MLEQQRADPAAGGGRIDEKCADFRGLGARIEGRGIPAGVAVAAEQRRPETPAAAANHSIVLFGDKVSLVGKQLSVDPEGAAQRRFDLRGPVVGRAQSTGRAGDQGFDLRDIGATAVRSTIAMRDARR